MLLPFIISLVLLPHRCFEGVWRSNKRQAVSDKTVDSCVNEVSFSSWNTCWTDVLTEFVPPKVGTHSTRTQSQWPTVSCRIVRQVASSSLFLYCLFGFHLSARALEEVQLVVNSFKLEIISFSLYVGVFGPICLFCWRRFCGLGPLAAAGVVAPQVLQGEQNRRLVRAKFNI